jgi:hypothetical protein
VIPQAARILEVLEDHRQQFLSTLRSMNPEQRTFRSRSGVWSPLEVGHHVVLVEQRSTGALTARRGQPSQTRPLRSQIGYALLWLVLKTGLRVRNPVAAAAPRPDITLVELEEMWEQTRSDLAAYLAGLTEEGLHDAAYKHPVGGPFNAGEALKFLVGHPEHHLRQLDRIRQQPSFPRS